MKSAPSTNICVCVCLCVCLQYCKETAVCKLVNHLLHSQGRVEVKAGVYVCPGHTHIRSDLIGAECAVCLPMAPEPTWPREANLYGLCKQGLCLQRTAGGRADTQFTHGRAHRRAHRRGGWTYMAGYTLYRAHTHVQTIHAHTLLDTQTNCMPYGRQSCSSIEEFLLFI